MPSSRKRPVLLLILVLACAWLLTALYHVFKPLPEGVGEAWPTRPAEDVAVLIDDTWVEQAAADSQGEPRRHFEIDPRALIDAHKAERAGGAQVLGYYHSHPGGNAEPSATDRAQAAHDGKLWAIVAPTQGGCEVRFFRDGEERFEALSYAVLPR